MLNSLEVDGTCQACGHETTADILEDMLVFLGHLTPVELEQLHAQAIQTAKFLDDRRRQFQGERQSIA